LKTANFAIVLSFYRSIVQSFNRFIVGLLGFSLFRIPAMLTFENTGNWPWIIGGCGACAVLLVACYLRTARPIPAATRFLLAALRVLMVALIFFCLLEPVVTEKIPFTERAPFFVLVDVSRSMTIKDCEQGKSRHELVQKILAETSSRLKDMRTMHEFHMFAFGNEFSAFDDTENIPAAEMQATALGDALEKVLQRAKGRTRGGVLLFSDGVNNSGRAPTPYAHFFREAGIPIFPVLLGDAAPTGRVKDVRVSSLNCPNSVLVGTTVSVVAEISFLGYRGKSFPVRVRLGEEVVQVQTVDVVQDHQWVKLAFQLRADNEGRHHVSVEVEPLPDELDARNNKLTTILNVGKETITACYLEARLRWERKFLTRLFSEMEGIKVEPVILPGSPVEAEQTLAGIDFSKFKVIVLGDMSAQMLGASACQRLYDAIAEGGGGLALLGGANSFGPGGYADSSLSVLSPVRISTSDRYMRKSLYVRPTRSGLNHFIMTLDSDRTENRRIWQSLPQVDGVVSSSGLKSAAFLLASADDETPLIAFHEIGRGRAIAFMSDGFWKWTLASDERARTALAKLWKQTLLWLARRDLKGEKRFWLTLERFLFFPGEHVEVRAQAESEKGIPISDATVKIAFKGGEGDPQAIEAPFFGSYYQARFIPATGGEFVIQATATRDGEEIGSDEATIFVNAPDPEKDSPIADHALLKYLADQSGGRTIKPTEVSRFLGDWRPEEKLSVVQKTVTHHVWDTPVVIVLFAVLLTMEWVVRRWARLV
jgi:hypothetical protein